MRVSGHVHHSDEKEKPNAQYVRLKRRLFIASFFFAKHSRRFSLRRVLRERRREEKKQEKKA